MPLNTGQYTFSYGRDCQIVVQGPYGTVTIPNITMFEAKQKTKAIEVELMNGVNVAADLAKGWDGSIEISRGDPTLDQLFTQIESDFIDSGIYTFSSIYAYITETTGVTTIQYEQVSMKLSDAGSYKGDEAVKQKIDFTAARRRLL